MTTLRLRKSIGRSPLRRVLLLLPLVLACFALSPAAQGVLPAPDGGYPGKNTAEGDDALFGLTTGADNTAIGFNALFSNTTGNDNTANGDSALSANTTGSFNTATGVLALVGNTTGLNNTADGFEALFSNTTGSSNVATGVDALLFNTTGIQNTANGAEALASNTIGFDNTANGSGALFLNATGSFNTATGVLALVGNTTGSSNTADGFEALFNNTTGSSNIALGYQAGANLNTGSNNIYIGSPGGAAGESNRIRIGTIGPGKNAFIAGIFGVTVGTGIPVIVDSSGRLGTTTSSERFKDAIKPMDKASEAILALQPVTFRYKKELDSEAIPQFGLVAEQVEKVNPELVAYDDDGKPYSVRYEAVNAMLLNEFLKEHRKVEALEATVVQQQKDFKATTAQQQRQIEALTAGLQKVSAQLEASRPAPQVVNNP